MTTPYEPKHLKLWTVPDSWFGKPWHGYYSSGFGRNRDSDALDRSNFEIAWRELSAVSDRVEIVHEGHWACGWINWIAIPQDDYEALKLADDMVAAYSDYPVLNEEHYSELEQSDADEVWANCYNTKERLAYIRKHRSQFDFHTLADLLSCVRGKYFAGYASELLH